MPGQSAKFTMYVRRVRTKQFTFGHCLTVHSHRELVKSQLNFSLCWQSVEIHKEGWEGAANLDAFVVQIREVIKFLKDGLYNNWPICLLSGPNKVASSRKWLSSLSGLIAIIVSMNSASFRSPVAFPTLSPNYVIQNSFCNFFVACGCLP